MRHFVRCIFLFFWCTVIADAQCLRTVHITIHSINFASGCDLDESNGLDAVLEIRDNNGSDIYLSEFENLSQVRSPQDSFILDLSVNPNSCGNGLLRFELGTFPVEQETAEFRVDIFDRDNIFPCAPYFVLFDDNHGGGQYNFDLLEMSGVIDVGSCMSFNYNLEYEISGVVENKISERICKEDSIIINGEVYSLNNPIGSDTILRSGICDSIINIEIEFYTTIPVDVIHPDIVCPNESNFIYTEIEFAEYNWSTGDTVFIPEILGGGNFSVTVADRRGCRDTAEFYMAEHIIDTLKVLGDTIFCPGASTILSVDSSAYQNVVWEMESEEYFYESENDSEITVIVTDENGCTQEESISLSYEPQDTFYIMRQVCDQNLVGIVDSVSTDLDCELHIIETVLKPEVECQIEVVVEQLEYPCEDGQYVNVTISMVEGTLPFDFLLYSFPGGVSWAGARMDDPSDTYTIQLPVGDFEVEAKNENGTEVSYLFSVEKPPELMYTIDDEYAIDSGEMLVLTINIDFTEVDEIRWLDANGNVLCDDCHQLEDFPEESKVYVVQLTDIYGCTYEEFILVTVSDNEDMLVEDVDRSVFMPNVFSPSDNLNNHLSIYGKSVRDIDRVQVFDRWGSKIFESTEMDYWDGRANNRLVLTGVYVVCFDISYVDGMLGRQCNDVLLVR